ncbi:MAG TPA: DNA mismatch repair endonuclease MutL [Opitutaceae bacterium]|jgi:DNA mismatch repair protein MutL|nr:DNA mismatch repair endonuclease MutL [Opitutaceae bacterium]
MPNIRILPDRVANQIAAGEVIERPAAVVKELVENALDAGATRVEVEFRAGGRALISVEDNGHGMIRDDALLSLERHATSKIAEAADLDRLGTYGFRGEALPSIASVSRFMLQTRTAADNAGTEILVNGGKFVHVRECGRPTGTRIEVAQLFNSVPARRKFLKSDATESAHIIQCVRLYALASPRVSFTLTEDGRVIFRSPECATLVERVAEIFGRQITEALLPLEAAEEGMRLNGLIGRPGIGRATRHEMITFVNARPVDSRTLNYALIESYHESLTKGRYPLAFVFFECDPAAVDVNVHPAKREVRFRSDAVVRGFMIRAVLQRLREFGVASAPVADNRGAPPEIPPASAGNGSRVGAPSMAAVSALPRREVLPAPAIPPASVRVLPASAVESQKPKIENVPWRFLGLAHGAYALFETTAGLVLLDRRAAHERVWFERLQAQFRTGSMASQRLLLPVPVELDPIATALLLDRLEFFHRHGFEVAGFGRNFFRIEAVPDWLEPADAELFLRDLLGALRDGRLQEKNIDLAREEFARLAVTRAIRLPAVASETESLALVAQLFATRTPLTSPAGRPTYVELNHGELARRFQK